MLFKLELHQHKTDQSECYGFMAYRTDGRSMPKGWITSYNAYRRLENEVELAAWIEFGIQSPTGDSSDHHHFTVPCLNFRQAKSIVLDQYMAVEVLMDEREAQEKKEYLYS